MDRDHLTQSSTQISKSNQAALTLNICRCLHLLSSSERLAALTNDAVNCFIPIRSTSQISQNPIVNLKQHHRHCSFGVLKRMLPTFQVEPTTGAGSAAHTPCVRIVTTWRVKRGASFEQTNYFKIPGVETKKHRHKHAQHPPSGHALK